MLLTNTEADKPTLGQVCTCCVVCCVLCVVCAFRGGGRRRCASAAAAPQCSTRRPQPPHTPCPTPHKTQQVVAVGPGKKGEDGAVSAPNLKAGATVLYSKYSGTEFDEGDDSFIVVRESDVLAELA